MSENTKKIKVTLTRSLIGATHTQRKIAVSLGVTKMNRTAEHFDSDMLRGMVNKIPHLVTVSESE